MTYCAGYENQQIQMLHMNSQGHIYSTWKALCVTELLNSCLPVVT